MSFQEYRKRSRDNWGTDQSGALTTEQIQLGAILRIADATEKMCLDREKLERDYQYMRNNRDRYRELYEAERRRSTALRGVITRMKKAASKEVQSER